MRRGFRVILLEASDELGGLLSTERIGEADLERFYHHLFTDDRFLLDTLRELNIPVDWTVTRTGFVRPEPAPIAEFSAPQHALTFPYLGPGLRVRMGLTLVRAAMAWRGGEKRFAELDEISARDWIVRWGGERVYLEFFEPLLEKKFGAETKDISAAFLVGRLGMRSGRTIKGERLGYPRGSFQRLIDGLEQRLRSAGCEIRMESPAQSFVVDGGRVVGVRTPGGTISADAVLATASAGAIGAACERSMLAEEASRMRRLPHQKALTVILGLERPLSPYYWLNVLDRDCPFGAIVDHARLCDPKPYGGPLVYLASYPDPDSPLWPMADDELVSHFAKHLRRVLPSARENEVRWSRVLRADYSSLVYRRGVRALIPERRAPQAPGLYYAGLFRCFPLRKIDLVGADACAAADLLAFDITEGRQGSADGRLPTRLEP